MMQRRQFLKLTAAIALTGAGAGLATPAEARQIQWRNWSGSQVCTPRRRRAPASLPELQDLVASSEGPLRPVGAGHSYTALVPTDGEILTLARMQGLVEHNPETLEATFHAGTQLSAIGAPLHAVNQALITMPDIDEQSLAGAIATGTHGTGLTIGAPVAGGNGGYHRDPYAEYAALSLAPGILDRGLGDHYWRG